MSFFDLITAANAICNSTFAQSITYTLKAPMSTPATITAVLLEGAEPETATPGSYAEIEITDANLPSGASKGDTVVVGSTTYMVAAINRRMFGSSRLVLHKK